MLRTFEVRFLRPACDNIITNKLIPCECHRKLCEAVTTQSSMLLFGFVRIIYIEAKNL